MLSLLMVLAAVQAAPQARTPPALALPPDAVLKVSLKGRGMQVYSCGANAGSTAYGWSFTAPDAVLFDPQGGVPKGRHYAGPTWEASDGSRVVGHLRAKAPSPDGAGVDWLLLDGAPSGQGEFGQVAYVRRVDTKGGQAPAAGCNADHVGEKAGVPYSATYEFYTAGR